MLAAIDIRNKTVTVGIRGPQPGLQAQTTMQLDQPQDSSGLDWLAIRRFGAATFRSEDEYAMLLRQMLFELGLFPQRGSLERGSLAGSALPSGALGVPEGAPLWSVWISSVVPAMTPTVCAAASVVFGVEPRLVGPGTKTGIKIRTDLPGEVGSDLVCAAVAGRRLARGPFLVADFGVAVTLSAVNASGEFLGAAFAPGVETQAESLRQQAAQLYEVRLDFPTHAIGRCTAESTRAGILYGTVGLVGELIRSMKSELAQGGLNSSGAESISVIGSGDIIGKEILRRLGYETFVPHLVLDGLAVIAEKAESIAEKASS
ncbi:MAG TPA: type III pantothenate kinase [Spirochaetales bacterium]|nr:type III pantothenate kinase [Spirochaetales bacterium]HPS15262.1 type III pantothenate kinase [Spirochaetales bacterium]